MEARGNFGGPGGPDERFRPKSKPAAAKASAPQFPGLLTSAAFVAGFKAPDYLWDGVLQSGFIYSCTAPTGAGKTAILLLLSSAVALGKSLAGREVRKGKVVYFAGENPDDVRMRWIGLAKETPGFDADNIDVLFVPGAFPIAALFDRASEEVAKVGDVVLVIVDTSAAYFEGADENSNVELGKHARVLRKLTNFPGRPCVIVACHPPKHAGDDNLLPRGGGSFIAEMDGNLTCVLDDAISRLHWQGKYRGPEFDPMAFELCPTKCDLLKDTRGRLVPTVVARDLSAAEETRREDASRSDEETVLRAMRDKPGASTADLAKAAKWITAAGPYKVRVQRVLKRLAKDKLVHKQRDRWRLTKAGKTEVENAETPV